MKNKKILIIMPLLLFCILLLIYTLAIQTFPNNLILFQGEKINIGTIVGLQLKDKKRGEKVENYQAVQTSSQGESDVSTEIGNVDLELTLFGKIPVKDVNVNVIPKTTVIPVGDIVGLKLYTSGVLVVGMTEIEGENNISYKPYENTDIKEGDMIVEMNKNEITCTADLIEAVNDSKGHTIDLKLVREGSIKESQITPAKTGKNEYKLGLWVRDAAAGVGTMTFYEPDTGMFAALGHGIVDIDTEKLIDIAKGEFVTASIQDIIKGKKGEPGKIQGSIENQTKLGEVYKNTNLGVYGKLTNSLPLNIQKRDALEVAPREEIKLGKATILCTLENNQKKEYEVEIEKLYLNNNENNKSMLLKVIDPKLLESTGGIIQGMSGSPIIQNGKLIGAVTHVLVNDPTTGYGIFGDLMIKQLREVESK
ncbi:MAG: SpoIVB peptidase [Clostridia bacterium]